MTKLAHRGVYVFLSLALLLVLVLPIVGPGAKPALAGNTSLDWRVWYYMNDPSWLPCADYDFGNGVRIREGGFGQIPGDTSNNGSGPLERVTDPDDPGNEVLAWTFDGSQPNGCQDGRSYFDLILPLDGADWSGYKAVKFDIKTTSTGTPSSDRGYFRLTCRLDKVGAAPGDYLNDEDEVWSAHKLDVGHDGAALGDKHKWSGGVAYGLYPPDGVWPQPERNAQRQGWSTFQLNFDRVKDSRGGYWANPGQYDVGNDWHYGLDVKGESREDRGIEPYDWDGIIERDNLESFRFITWLYNNRWIGSGETMTIYFDNIELVPWPVGGIVEPVDKVGLLVPWIVLAVLLIGGMSWFALRRRRAQS